MIVLYFLSFRYWVRRGDKQPTLRGGEHRAAVHFLPFSVAGIVGAASGEWDHRRMTWSMCEYSYLLKAIFGPSGTASGSMRPSMTALCDRMSAWVAEDFQQLFGPMQSTKLHRLLAHLQDEFIYRGNVQDADTGLNEAEHKPLKASHRRTNQKRADIGLQMLMAEQVSRVLRSAGGSSQTAPYSHPGASATAQSALDEQNDVEEGDEDDREQSITLTRTNDVCTRTTKARSSSLATRRGTCAVSKLELELPGCGQALGLSPDCMVTTWGAAYLSSGARWSDGRRQIVRASAQYFGSPWYDWVAYRDAETGCRYGRARALVCSVGCAEQRKVVLEAAVPAQPEDDCPFTAYGCRRLKWDVQSGATTPTFVAVLLSDITCVLCVEHDWEDWVGRHGLTAMPAVVPSSADDVRDRRFFTNAFASE